MSSLDDLADQTAIEGTYVMTASPATQAAKAPVGAPVTSFTGEVVRAIADGVPRAPEALDMNSLYRHIRHQLVSRGMPVPQQRSGDQGHAIALFRNQWIPPYEEPTLAAQREEWFREIQERMLWYVRNVPVIGKDRLRNDFGEL